MNLLLNVLWAILGGGLVIAVEYVLGGIVLCLTVVGIPFGLQCFKLAKLALTPFGHDVEVDRTVSPGGPLEAAMNVVWFVFAGLWTFLTHVGLGISLAVTIIGIPFAFQHLKLAILALFPFGRRVVEV